MKTTNTCTTLALFTADVEKYMSTPMAAFAATLEGCAICGTTTANAYVLICGHGAHHACNVCAKSKAKITKTESVRGGIKVCCGAADCKALALDKPLPAPGVTALLVHGAKMLEYELHEAKSAAIRGEDTSMADATRENIRKTRKRRTKADMIDFEGEEAYAERKANQREAKAARTEAKRKNEADHRCRVAFQRFVLQRHGWGKIKEIEGSDFKEDSIEFSDDGDDGIVFD